ncbi:hypothetical protein JKP88DRAFT_181932 [Tribonema minus]|uniref:Uncharacterized protein n=1 Tax=Tribonema minus TaxID=303371 RepID=A0A835YXN2_9STRA|nr:hypothetical protein JKP88DRAFT_181932 [Tribonema minus]
MTNPIDQSAQRAVEGDTERDQVAPANDNAPEPERWPHQLWLDMDGVLADFDSAASKALRTDNSYKWEWLHGSKAFWDTLNQNPNFFGDLPPMVDCLVLFDKVEHLRPIILTALPKVGAEEVDAQKRAWVAKYLGEDVRVVTCQTHEKPDYCGLGDVLVDDRSVNKARWEAEGGRYVIHTSANDSIRQLREMGVI